MKWNVELTDTFNGEANYAWGRSWQIETETEDAAEVVRVLFEDEYTQKELDTLEVIDDSDCITIRPPEGLNLIWFITPIISEDV